MLTNRIVSDIIKLQSINERGVIMNKRIKELRQVLQISQEELAQAMGLSKSGVSNIECGNRKVNDKHIRMLNMTYHVNPDWLRSGNGDMFNPVDDSPLAIIKEQYNLSDKAATIVQNFLKLTQSEQEAFIEQAGKIFHTDN